VDGACHTATIAALKPIPKNWRLLYTVLLKSQSLPSSPFPLKPPPPSSPGPLPSLIKEPIQRISAV
jgi:hypothetical protein